MAEQTGQQPSTPSSRRWATPLIVLLVAALTIAVLGVMWWRAPGLGDSGDAGADTTATATTRAGILVVIGAIVAALGATLALLENRRANLAAHERESQVLAETRRANRQADQR